MIGSIFKGITKIFGSKSDRDLKELSPVVEKVNTAFAKLSSISDDELRGKTQEFKAKISEFLAEIDEEIEGIRTETQVDNIDLFVKDDLFKKIDLLKKKRDEELEKVLNEILPEAFAVVKETARRLATNKQLVVTATDWDKELSASTRHKKPVSIDGDKAIWSNTWEAAGQMITWNMVHYDVQLIGGLVLHKGMISEMATGEGKTLVSTLPSYLNALSGLGVHVVTVNDYLARRDCEWNGPLFEFHGLKVDCIDYHQPNSAERRKAYQADITYGTNNEFGFDYLRDNMANSLDELVQRKHHYAMVDEVDSVLIDDARTPLIISGPVPRGDDQQFYALKSRIEKLVNAQKAYANTALLDAKKAITANNDKEGGFKLLQAYRGLPKNSSLIKFLGEPGMKNILTKTENFYMQDQQKEMHKVDADLYFVIDEKINSVDLTEKGVELITSSGEDTNFFIIPDVGSEIAEIEKSTMPEDEKAKRKEQLMLEFTIKSERIHTINQLLKAYCMFERDVEYIIVDGKVKIVDEQTGRVMEGRRYSDGLHQAIEAKENVKVEAATQTYATITLQNFFRMYHKLCGMTGTATTEAGEFWEIYKLDVVEIPTNRAISRKDEEDVIYKTKREKYNAVIDEIVKLTDAGRPVLVGTTSVEVSELLGRMLTMRKIKHNVLNAKQNQREADIVAEAGQKSAVTIATNMAGRGTDIKLGEGVKEVGGLAIIGTERHESRRVDRQLRGRAGRQGDPGSSKFYVSLEDDLMRLFGSERIASIMDRLGMKEGENIEHSMITKNIERAQRKVEQNNFGIRKRLLEYDDVMNSQREVIYTKRRNALYGDKLALDISNMLADTCDELVETYQDQKNYAEFKFEVMRVFAHEPNITQDEFLGGKTEAVSNMLFEELEAHYTKKIADIASNAKPVIDDVYTSRGSQFENIAVPFSDGIHNMQIPVNLKKAYETQAREITKTYEKFATLFVIDNDWKEHLREMDDLKQSSQNAVFEQKDPLLIYKLESFNLFKTMVTRINKELLGMLFKSFIPVENASEVKQAEQPKRVDTSKLKTSRTDDLAESQRNTQVAAQGASEVQKPAQVKGVIKIGRNDPCPCGSGKKYKSCHGKEELN
ncbi:MAG: preprotein translocase subunit SecA [Bacteroidia bacterium]|nr:preprotein translocase subunit SecA [Bacteroidia bacterium]MCF8426747.1 preprotein translocase subunit SecA [Bacteroidia bacterium]MCF8446716.1 preprotein translocase subunit SecA [Bacteroidia bacterium]